MSTPLIDNTKHPLDWAKCGTAAQWKAHRRRGQTPCAACKAANARAQKVRRERARERAQH